MARRYVNPTRRSQADWDRLPGRIQRLGGRAEVEALIARDPGPWTLIKTADLEGLANGAPSHDGIAMDWPELAALLRGGLR